MFVSCFNFFYSYFVYFQKNSIFVRLFIYLVSILFLKKILVFLICFIIKIIKKKALLLFFD
jgi:hypothetical protein